jgi:tetratricopeptide (TPR) repeat protein
MRLILVAVAFYLLNANSARAALDPESKVGYQLRVVVRIADHPQFTDFFRREFRRELEGQLQAALGPLGKAEVIDLRTVDKKDWEPLWKLAEDKGLEALDSFNELGGGKTHFVHLDFVDGRFELRARQHDGASGFVTPLVRQASTHDRGFVTRQAGLMIGRDFGLVGTLDPPGSGQNVVLRIKGGELGAIDKWVKKDEVFAVMLVRAERKRQAPAPGEKGPARAATVQAGTRVDGTLLRVVGDPQRDGIVRCQIFHRYEDPLPTKGVLGYRCVKLGTVEAPLRLQLVDPNGVPHKIPLQVYAKATDFPDGTREGEAVPGRDGMFVSKDPFANVAFVRVLLGNRRLARIPVEILDDRVEVRTIRLEEDAELRDRLEADHRALLTRVTDARLIQVRIFQEITALEQVGKKQQALNRGKDVMKSLESMDQDLQEEIGRFRERAKGIRNAAGLADDADQLLTTMRGKQNELKEHLEALKGAIADEANPEIQDKKKKVQDLVRKAELLSSQAEYDEALKMYESALAEVQDEPVAKQRIETAYNNLKTAWALKDGDPVHGEARRFIYGDWARLATIQGVRDQLPNARRAFEKCKAVGDRLTINKMHLASVEVVARFGDELKKLADSAKEEEDRKTLEIYLKVNEDLQKLLKDIQEYVAAGQKK